MKANKIAHILIILLILVVNIGCDQVSKKIVRQHVDYNEKISLISDHFTLTKIENTGAFLSMGDSLPQFLSLLVLIILPLLALVGALAYLFLKKGLSKYKIVGIGFVVSGGIGNIFDRIMYGSVTDFLHIDFGLFQTGIFNMADLSIMTGAFILLFETFVNKRKANLNLE